MTVFALIQLTGWLDDRYFAVAPRVGEDWMRGVLIVYLYLKSAVLILVATFIAHLVLRAQWIALVGMHSVHPGGIDWLRLRLGTIQRRAERRRLASVPEQIDRADDRATVVFALGTYLGTLLLVLTASAVLVLLAALLLKALLPRHIGAVPLLGGLFALLVAPFLLATALDALLGRRIAADGRAARMLEAVFGVYGRIGFGSSGSAAYALVASRGGHRTIRWITAVAILAAVLVVAGQLQAETDPERFGEYAVWPDDAAGTARSIRSPHYDRLRDPRRDPAVPFIQDEVIRHDWLRLTVPFSPAHDAQALGAHCPEVLAPRADVDPDARRVAFADCMQQLHPVSIDGRRLADLHYDLGSDPRTDRPALRAMLDMRGLGRGRHELRVGRPADANGTEAREVVIPFWR
uniref:Uncharacterized protein n=1 Tax=Coralloluteibacterium stylophorae TaxID=1776034 RepID=A0A8J7VX80_9GAMM